MTQRFDLIVRDKIPQGKGREEKTIARRVGTGKALDTGMIQCFLCDGLALTGKFTLAPWSGRTRDDPDT